MRRFLPLLLLATLLPGCETARDLTSRVTGPATPAGQPGFVRGFLGGVAAEEPIAAAIARDVLSAGGNAADAVIAASFAMSVTLPSRVGLGGGGVCMVFEARRGEPETVIFPAGARGGVPPDADRPAAIPMLARGLFALSTRLPAGRPFEELVAPAEQLARFGAPMSRALFADITAVQGPLFADPNVRAVFATATGAPIRIGDRFVNPPLAGTLSGLRVQGVGDLYIGALARRLEEASAQAGGGAISLAELRAALPQVAPPIAVEAGGGVRLAVPPTTGGTAVAVAFRALQSRQPLAVAQARALTVIAAAPGVPSEAELVNAGLSPRLPGPLPPSAGVIAFDRNGNAAACAFTMNNLFGTGRIAPGMGFLMAAAPGIGSVVPPPLAVGIAYAPVTRAFRSAGAASGQADAPLALAAAMGADILRNAQPTDAVTSGAPAAPLGRVELGSCPRFLPGSPALCAAAADPRGAGVALGATER